MSVTIEIKGLDKLIAKASKYPKSIIGGIARGIRESAFVLEAESKKAITQGETRAIDTGRLRADIIVRQITPLSATIGPLVHYAVYVHEGTHKMRPRPYLTKGAEMANDKIKGIFTKIINDALS